MNDKIELSLPRKSEYVSVARLTASVIANNMGFNFEDIEDIKVAVGEACNNVIMHCVECEEFTINFEIDKDSFIAVIKDFGRGFNLENYKAPNLADPSVGGLGLFIIKSLMDEVDVNSEIGNGTSITMKKKIN